MSKSVATVAVGAMLIVPQSAGAAVASDTMLASFTQDELDGNWVADRQFPSGGVTSVTAHGRDDVAQVGIVGEGRDDDPFRHFEGIKKVDDVGPAVKIDLYVPAEWEHADTSPANLGFWAKDEPLTAYPLILYRNSDTVEAGFYTWEYDWDAGAWAYVPSHVEVNYDGWNTLGMVLNEGVISYAINGEDTGSIASGSDTFGEVFLNHYNDGVNDYMAHWHAGVTDINPLDPELVEDPDPVDPDPVDPDPVDPDPVDPTPPAPVDHGTPNFGDVAGNTHAAGIDLIYRYGITTGTGDTSYNPSGDLSRGQMGSFLVRLLALTDSDVSRPVSHDAAMQLLVERGTFHGQANGELDSNGTITRGQAASVLVRVIDDVTGEELPTGSEQFPDAGDTHGENIAKLTTLGVINGYGDGTFRPHVELQRDQMASIIARTIAELIGSGKITDLDA